MHLNSLFLFLYLYTELRKLLLCTSVLPRLVKNIKSMIMSVEIKHMIMSVEIKLRVPI